MINTLVMSKKDLIRRVWNECFNDSPEYTDMYFSRIYTDDDALLEVAEDGRPVSILQVHPYTMLFHGAEAQLGYICGAATARKYRGRGHMPRLMLQALDLSYERGDMMCALIPAHDWLYFFFERFGFSNVYLADRQCFTSFHPFNTLADYYEVADNYAPEVYDAFAYYERQRGGGVLHSRRDFLNILDDLSFRPSGTFVAVGRHDAPVAGMAWGWDCGNFIQVNELLGIDHDARTGALHALRSVFPNRQFTVLAPADDSTRRHLHSRGMGRIVNALKALDIIAGANPKYSATIRITDPLLEVNSHTYRLENGRCNIVDHPCEKLNFDVSIDVFTRILFSAPSTGSMLSFPSERTHIALMPH